MSMGSMAMRETKGEELRVEGANKLEGKHRGQWSRGSNRKEMGRAEVSMGSMVMREMKGLGLCVGKSQGIWGKNQGRGGRWGRRQVSCAKKVGRVECECHIGGGRLMDLRVRVVGMSFFFL